MTSRDAAMILVVDDDAAEAAGIADVLTAAGYRVSVRLDSLSGLFAVEQAAPALVILDWGLPFLTSDIFLSVLRDGLAAPPPVIVLLGSNGDSESARAAGARATLTQPQDADELLRTVRGALRGERVVTD